MRTIDDIMAACEIIVDDDGREHWIFKGATTKGMPWVRGPDRRKGGAVTAMSGPRFVWQEFRQKAMPPHLLAVRTCHYKCCLHPHCQSALTRKQWAARQIGKGVGDPRRRLGGLMSIERKRVVDEQMAAMILASDGSAPQVAKQLGIGEWCVRDVRTGRNLMAARTAASPMFRPLIDSRIQCSTT